MEEKLKQLFVLCETEQGSDIHLCVGETPRLRRNGLLCPVANMQPLTQPEMDTCCVALIDTTLPPGMATENPLERALSILFAKGAVDGAITSPTGHRYRFNVFRENNRTAIALRRLDDCFLPLQTLGLPEQLADFCDLKDGLVVVSGPTGAGKSTTLATLIDQINRTSEGHIITIEDPVEYVHASQKSLVSQRQIGRDATSFNAALVESLRQDPDVILVGEIRELETIRTAIIAAETGHLVFTTLHAGDCVGAIERLVAVFPSGEQEGIRRQLSLVLRGILAQHLLPSAETGRIRVACSELLVVTPAIANLIAQGKSQQIYSAIETGGNMGMQTMEQSLARLLLAGSITEQTALAMARVPRLVKEWVQSERRKGRP